MKHINVCSFCKGEGQLPQDLYPLGIKPDTCPCCFGDGFIETSQLEGDSQTATKQQMKPKHSNTFNESYVYQGFKAERLHRRKQRNSVLIGLLTQAA